MTEIKIAVSDRMNKVIQDIADDLGVKKAEYVKNLVVEELMNIKFGMKNEKRSDKK
jgi:hypothetical protein